jgi:hypothetical protein
MTMTMSWTSSSHARPISISALSNVLIVKARDNAVGRRDTRRQRVVAKMIDGGHRFDLFSRCPV